MQIEKLPDYSIRQADDVTPELESNDARLDSPEMLGILSPEPRIDDISFVPWQHRIGTHIMPSNSGPQR